MLEFEPWSYDKHLVAFRHAVDGESTPYLAFLSIIFWVQLHNVLEKSLNHATSEAVGNIVGTTISVHDPEDDG